MKITVLDRASLGKDTPISILYDLGEVEIYEKTSSEEIFERIKESEVIIINKVKITKEVLNSARKLRLICVFATGFDNIDITTAKQRGIAVCNVPGYSTDSVALFTAATVLALASHLIEYNQFVKSGEYTESGVPNRLIPVYHEIAGKTWGIVGYGNIGKAVARIADALGAKILVYKRTPVVDRECVDIDTLCRNSDIISIHCPLNEGTRDLIDKKKISLMKNDVIIVNEARGAVVSESDIAEALSARKIGAFGCDVYSAEPLLKENPLYSVKDLPNVLLTPHAAWGSYESRARCIGIIHDNIVSFYEGKNKNRVDK